MGNSTSGMRTGSSRSVRVLVTDDTALYRRMLSDLFARIPGVEVVGTAYDGADCLMMIDKVNPDLVTLDINMPKLDGLAVLDQIRKRKLGVHAVMVSSPTAESAEQTVRALQNGALDMILKPSGASVEENRKSLERQLLQHVETVQGLLARTAGRRQSNALLSNRMGESGSVGPSCRYPGPEETSIANADKGSFGRPTANAGPRKKCSTFECLCVGVSTGGPAALATILPKLPRGLPVPIFIVQHMPPVFTKSMAFHLSQSTSFPVIEATDGTLAQPGSVYVAPGGRQMKIAKINNRLEISVTDDPAVNSCKPSVDYLFDSVASECQGNVLAMILTGMGNDGLAGCKKLHAQGAHIIAQSAETCVVYGMPRQIVEKNLADEIVPLPEIAQRLCQLLKG
ncbi:MAG: chemotaxis-specific protein-glutamate methyltransferase CheB [Pirellula sp.]|nr:chemotaxis-specific protein-glutamate methyltransferase CheB [Pirellula sp.]